MIWTILTIFLIIFCFSYKNIENLKNMKMENNCPEIINNYTNFCTYDNNNNKCKCVFQKDDVLSNFDSPPQCCDKYCNKLGKDECVEDKRIYYWCVDGDKCTRKNAFIYNNKISGNNCGQDILTNQINQPYKTKESCENTIDKCNSTTDQTKCINKDGCGWCTNIDGDGKCVEGTESGPLDIVKYNFCYPNKLYKNSWKYH